MDTVTDSQSTLKGQVKAVTHCPNYKCRKPIKPDDPIYYLTNGDHGFEPHCPVCFEARALSQIRSYDGDIEKAKASMLKGYRSVKSHKRFNCYECNRPVWKRPRSNNPRVFCSQDCSSRFYSRMALRIKNNTLKEQFIICNVCNSEFIPNRTDSRYCSSKCRQKAYRQRKTD